MRYLAWIFALAVAFVALQTSMPTNSAQLAAGGIDINELHMRADKNMPVMVIDHPV